MKTKEIEALVQSELEQITKKIDSNYGEAARAHTDAYTVQAFRLDDMRRGLIEGRWALEFILRAIRGSRQPDSRSRADRPCEGECGDRRSILPSALSRGANADGAEEQQ